MRKGGATCRALSPHERASPRRLPALQRTQPRAALARLAGGACLRPMPRAAVHRQAGRAGCGGFDAHGARRPAGLGGLLGAVVRALPDDGAAVRGRGRAARVQVRLARSIPRRNRRWVVVSGSASHPGLVQAGPELARQAGAMGVPTSCAGPASTFDPTGRYREPILPDLIDDSMPRSSASARRARADARFSGLAARALKPGVLDTKTKELIATAISVAVRCDGCIGFTPNGDPRRRQPRKCSRPCRWRSTWGAGPSMIYASEALRAFDELSPAADAS